MKRVSFILAFIFFIFIHYFGLSQDSDFKQPDNINLSSLYKSSESFLVNPQKIIRKFHFSNKYRRIFFERKYIACDSKSESENNRGVIYAINPWNNGSNNNERAYRFFDDAFRKNNSNTEALYNKCVFSSKINDFEVVTKLYEHLTEASLTDEILHYNAGIAYHETSEDGLALSCFSIVSNKKIRNKAKINKGILLEKSGFYKEALLNLQGLSGRKIISDAFLIKGRIAKETHDEDQISFYLHRALINNKKNTKAQLALADFYTYSGKFKKAFHAYKTLTDKGFYKSEANIGIAYTHYSQGNYDKALKYYDNALFYDSNNEYALTGAGFTEINCGNYYHSITYFNLALQNDINFIPAYIGKANAFYFMHNPYYSSYYFDIALEIKPDYELIPIGYVIAGRANMSIENHIKARIFFNRAISADSNFFLPYFDLGNLEQSLGNYSESITYYTKALKLKPDCLECLINKGNAELYNEQHSEAYEDFKKAYQLNSANINVLKGLGSAATELDKYQEAFTYFEKAISLYPNDGYLYSAMGLCKDYFARNLEFNGKLDSAEKIYSSAIDDFGKGMLLDPFNKILYENNKGIVLKDLGCFSSADSLFGKYETAACLNNRAIVYSLQGNYNQAEEYLLKAMKIDSSVNSWVYLHNKLNLSGVGYADYTNDTMILKELLKTEKKRKAYYKTNYIDIFYYKTNNENIEIKEVKMPFLYEIRLPELQGFVEKYYMFPVHKVKNKPLLEKKQRPIRDKKQIKRISPEKCVTF